MIHYTQTKSSKARKPCRIEQSKFSKSIKRLEKLFEESKTSYYINNSYDSTIYYHNYLEEFRDLLRTDINSTKFHLALIDLYKQVFVRMKYYQSPIMTKSYSEQYKILKNKR